jgi:hypothetical protein
VRDHNWHIDGNDEMPELAEVLLDDEVSKPVESGTRTRCPANKRSS